MRNEWDEDMVSSDDFVEWMRWRWIDCYDFYKMDEVIDGRLLWFYGMNEVIVVGCYVFFE